MIRVSSSGSFKKTEDFINKMKRGDAFARLEQFGQMGVDILASATPIDTGLTKESWTYSIIRKRRRYSIIWHNTNVVSGVPVVILIQYGHATRDGAWVEGRDYINPVIQPLFDKIANDVWKEVTRNA